MAGLLFIYIFKFIPSIRDSSISDTNQSICRLIHLFIHSPIYSLTGATIHPSIHPSIHSFIHPFIQSFINPFIQTILYLPTHPFLSNPAVSFICSSIPQFFRFLIYPLSHQLVRSLTSARLQTNLLFVCSVEIFLESKGYHEMDFYFTFWIFSALVSTCYTFTWDIKMDWGLMAKDNNGNTFLRAQLLYKHKVRAETWSGVGVTGDRSGKLARVDHSAQPPSFEDAAWSSG